jgi:hypothetical protein
MLSRQSSVSLEQSWLEKWQVRENAIIIKHWFIYH